jgi:hypothetical protein
MLRLGRLSGRHFVSLHISPINLCSTSSHFYYGIHVRLFRSASWINKGDERPTLYVDGGPTYSCSVSGSAPRCSCSAARSAIDGYPALLLPLLHRAAPLLPAAASALRPASPDGAGTAAPTHGDRSLGRRLATEAAMQGEASVPGREALRSHLLLRLLCPMQMAKEAASRYDACCKCMFQIF